jgi:hypothetical protein
MMTVLLTNKTVGQTETAKIGDTVEVTLNDENGMPITVTGQVEDILE